MGAISSKTAPSPEKTHARGAGKGHARTAGKTRVRRTPPDKSGKVRLAVCISGQIGRLELRSKLSNIVRANAAYGMVAVFVALQVGVPLSSNNLTAAKESQPLAVSGAPTGCGAASGYRSVAEVAAALGPYFGGGWQGKHEAKVDLALRRVDAALRRVNVSASARGQAESRMANQLRQFVLWRECALLIDAYEQREQKQFDMVVRVRDSALVLRPMRIFKSPYYTTRKCNSAHGTADKMAVFNRSVAHTALSAIAEHLLQLRPQRGGGPLQGAQASNSKQLLQHALKASNVPVDKKDALPVVDARRCGCAGNGSSTAFWCPVAAHKDCWPRKQRGKLVRSNFTQPYKPLCDARTRGLDSLPKDAELQPPPPPSLAWLQPCTQSEEGGDAGRRRRLSAGAANATSLGAWVQLPSDACYVFDAKLAKAIAGLVPASDTLMELGAGTGCYTAAYHHAGIKVLAGIDGAEGISEHTHGWVQQFNLASGVLDTPADWVVSLEVAEHIPKEYESAFVANLVTNARKAIVLSWSDVRSVAAGHVNARKADYVEALMLKHGFMVNEYITGELRLAAVLPWFKSGIRAFQRV